MKAAAELDDGDGLTLARGTAREVVQLRELDRGEAPGGRGVRHDPAFRVAELRACLRPVVQAEHRLHDRRDVLRDVHVPCAAPVLAARVLPAAEVDPEGLAHRRDGAGEHHPPFGRLRRVDVQPVLVGERLDRGDVVRCRAERLGELLARERLPRRAAQVRPDLAARPAAQDEGDGNLLVRVDRADQPRAGQRHALAARNRVTCLRLIRH